jgi:ABC-type bacteriocin/lantibiotic exporter with double-glycine peptidase domain
MIGVDVERVAMFCVTNIDVVTYPLVDICVAFAMLYSVLGWRPLSLAAAAMVLFTWLNVSNIRRYSRAQAAVMEARDAKMEIVSEALSGIRQIKFSATEGRWQARIDEAREKELGHLWTALVADIIIAVSCAAIPVVLTVVSFAAYGYYEGRLRPSVAFATLTIFARFRTTLVLLPVSRCLPGL